MDEVPLESINAIKKSPTYRHTKITGCEHTRDQSLRVSFDSYIPISAGEKKVCLPGVAGYRISTSDTVIDSMSYYDLGFNGVRRGELTSEEISRIRAILTAWDTSALASRSPSGVYCAFDLLGPTSVRWYDEDRNALRSALDLAKALEEIIATKPLWKWPI